MGTRDLIVADYLSRLEASLHLPAKQRSRILAEVEDGLQSCIDANAESGMPPGDAARTAVAEFGDPVSLAAQFARALAPGMARRTGLALVLSGPLIGMVWVVAIGHGLDWSSRIGSVLAALPYFPVILAVTVPAAVIAALHGPMSLRRAISSRSAMAAARLAGLGCLLGDSLLITTTVGGLHSGRAGWIALAIGLSILRLAGAATATWRLSRLRAAGC